MKCPVCEYESGQNTQCPQCSSDLMINRVLQQLKGEPAKMSALEKIPVPEAKKERILISAIFLLAASFLFAAFKFNELTNSALKNPTNAVSTGGLSPEVLHSLSQSLNQVIELYVKEREERIRLTKLLNVQSGAGIEQENAAGQIGAANP